MLLAPVAGAQEILEFQGHYYLTTAAYGTWPEAEAEAVAIGGHLVAINSQQENDFIRDNFASYAGARIWIGLSDQDEEGRFVWSNGDPVIFENFAPGEPNDTSANEDYVEMRSDGTWNDIFNDSTFKGIIELTEAPSVPPEQRAALIQLYHATGGDRWTDGSGWRQEPLAEDGFNDDPCREPRWHGVRCGVEAVVEVRLPRNNLDGYIPYEIGELRGLRILNLRSNRLYGSIPRELGSLTAMEELCLAANQLTEAIPKELTNLTRLRVLRLGRNQLYSKIPPELTDLPNLEFLEVPFNRLEGEIPKELANLTSLRELRLGGNSLTGNIPPELGDLSELRILDVSQNQLTGEIPAELGKLVKLEQLGLSSNRLEGSLPVEMSQLKRLQVLDLSGNWLSGTIPSFLSDMNGLCSIHLSDNRLSGAIPGEFANMEHLYFLQLADNRLTGPIPAELGSIQLLLELDLSGNQLTGTIPAELALLRNGSLLRLSRNLLEGAVPAGLAMRRTGTLDIRQNNLTSVEGEYFDHLDRAQVGAARWDTLQNVAGVYPQLVIGGGFEAVLLLNNASSHTWIGTAFLNGARWPADRPWRIDGRDLTGETSFGIALSPGQSRRFVLSSDSEVAIAGWLTLRADGNSLPEDLATTYFFRASDGAGLTNSTGISASAFSTAFRFPVEHTETASTGVSLRSVGGRGASIHLISFSGNRIGYAHADSDQVKMLGELFEELPEYLIGSVEITSDVPFYATVIRLEARGDGEVQLTSVSPLVR